MMFCTRCRIALVTLLISVSVFATSENTSNDAANSSVTQSTKPADVLSDTGGVDVRPYLQYVMGRVRQNWYNLGPEVARSPQFKKGIVVVEFEILQNGKLKNVRMTARTGDVRLDQAAGGAVLASAPFRSLPKGLPNDHLVLRIHFYYNLQPPK